MTVVVCEELKTLWRFSGGEVGGEGAGWVNGGGRKGK